jgi:ribosomal protein S8
MQRPRRQDQLKYFDGEPVIHEIRQVSKPGRRVCLGQNLPRVNAVSAFPCYQHQDHG